VEKIVLWPLGGVAYVMPPPRPGPVLWSVAAGPLVNLVLVPVTLGLLWLARTRGGLPPDAARFLFNLTAINLGLLLFNLIPIYPLDGGQITHALLWFVVGRARSLTIVSFVGLLAGTALVGILFTLGQWWLMVVTIFMVGQALLGLVQADVLSRPEVAAAEQAALTAIPADAVPLQAIAFYSALLQREPDNIEARYQRGIQYRKQGKLDLAIADYDECLRREPDSADVYYLRAIALTARGDYQRALDDYRAALRDNPDDENSHNNLAHLLAMCPTAGFRNGAEAVRHATRACDLTRWQKAGFLDTLASAYAELANFSEAARWQEKALGDADFAAASGDKARERLRLYTAARTKA
jgi:hypothetical protein